MSRALADGEAGGNHPGGSAPADLPGFRVRLRGGVYESVNRARRADHAFADDGALENWPPPGQFSALETIHAQPWEPAGEPESTITRLTESLLAQPRLLDAVIYAPDRVLDRLLGTCSGYPLVDVWIAMCWTAEAAWQAVTSPGSPGVPPGSLAVLRPLAARLRFLVLSEPMRARGRRQVPGRPRDARAWWDSAADQMIGGGNGVLPRVLGQRPWEDLVDRCRAARAEWQDCLDSHQSHRLLRAARPGDIERELRLVLFQGEGWSHPLALSGKPLAEPAALTFEDQEAIGDLVKDHLLPRFAIGTVLRLVLDDDRRPWRLTRWALAAVVTAAAVAAVALAGRLELHQALLATAACYFLICAGILLPIEGWGLIWLLRMPAASAVGVIALVSFMPGGWLDSFTPGGWRNGSPTGWDGARGWLAVAVLGAASLGYLVIEARNHGVQPRQAITRAFGVTVIGAAHALMVALVGLVVIAPAFTQAGDRQHNMWAHLAHHQAVTLLSLATAWCLAFGVFSQILWDDQPITAPLAHLNWRRAK
jgi:hypothetical protein